MELPHPICRNAEDVGHEFNDPSDNSTRRTAPLLNRVLDKPQPNQVGELAQPPGPRGSVGHRESRDALKLTVNRLAIADLFPQIDVRGDIEEQREVINDRIGPTETSDKCRRQRFQRPLRQRQIPGRQAGERPSPAQDVQGLVQPGSSSKLLLAR